MSSLHILLTVASSLVAFIFVGFTIHKLLKEDQGTDQMKDIATAIQDGARAFLAREFKMLGITVLIVAILLGILTSIGKVGVFNTGEAVAFVIGAIVSAFAGWLGMKVATEANVRTTQALAGSFTKAFSIAFSGGAVMGMTVVSFGLLGIIAIFAITGSAEILIGYAFGSSLVALFMRVGGGIYTKSADVGADLVGKVEAGIPEDDPRNPAVIADAVGDNVGDVAGMGSDLFESYVSAIIAAMILGAAVLGMNGMLLPIFLAASGIIISLIGIMFVRVNKSAENAPFEEQTKAVRGAMSRGVLISNILMIIASYFIVSRLMGDLSLFWALLVGIVAGFIIGKATEYYTSGDKAPTASIITASETGAPTNIIQGLSVGMMSTFIPVVAVAIATVLAHDIAGLYGIAIASVGILVILGVNLSMDSYGPIADNAAGIAELAGLGENVRSRADALDAVGNTTAAIGKGFAIGSAALASLAWIATFFHTAGLAEVNLLSPRVIAGIFVGSAIAFVISAFLMRAVAKGGYEVVKEVRRQFKETPGLLEGTAKPDYKRVVDITTARALKDTAIPGLIVIFTPLIVGLLGGLEAVGGLLVGTLASGFLMALFMSNAGGAWDNAKKYIEKGDIAGEKKGGDAHKAAVIGDTVGDPLKDTSGPSMNILIKLMSIVALIIAPLIALR